MFNISNILKNLYCDFVVLFRIRWLDVSTRVGFIIDKYAALISSISVSSNPTTLKYLGNDYFSDSKYGLLGLSIMLKDFYKYYFVEDLKAPIIFDVGANIGNFSLSANTFYKDSKIMSFEPVSQTFSLLEKNVSNYDNISCYNIALGNENSEKEMYFVPDELERSSFSKSNLIKEESANKQLVTVYKLDSLIQEKNMEFPDILKIDVEGFELEVLKGAAKTLTSTKVVIVEIHLQKSSESFVEILSIMFKAGFGIHKVGKTWKDNNTRTFKVMELIFTKL